MEGKSREVEKSTIFASRTSSLNSIKYFFPANLGFHRLTQKSLKPHNRCILIHKISRRRITKKGLLFKLRPTKLDRFSTVK